MKKLNYGIIGMGGIVEKHLKGYSALSDQVKLTACCDLREDRMKEIADKYSIPRRFTDYRELLRQPDLDFVSVCLPNHLHAPVTVEALEAGKHVHCEKPMAVSAETARQMLEARDRTGKQLMIGLNNRFTAQSQYTKRCVDAGELGEVYFIKCGWLRRAGLPHSGWFTDKALSGGGPLIDLGVHFIDLALYFLGYPALESVMARTFCKFGNSPERPLYTYPGAKAAPGERFDVEDLATGLISLQTGAAIQFEVSWASNIEKEKNFFELYGTKGGIRMETDFSGQPDFRAFRVWEGQLVDVQPVLNPFLSDLTEFGHFVSCVRDNTPPTVVKVEEAARMLELIEGIYRSAESHKPVFF